jgi:valyl-tRNA synthetase
VLGFVLDRLLRLLHPVMPFVTDELWAALTGGQSVLAAAWPGRRAAGGEGGPDSLAAFADPAAEAEIGALMRVVTEVRRFRSDQGLRPTQPVPAVLAGIEATPLAPHEARIRALLRLTQPAADFAPTASVQAEGVTVRLDTAATIDVAAERRRLAKDLAAARTEADAAERKLATPSFIERAPAAVVAKSRDRLTAARADIARIEARLSALPPAGP